MGKIIVIEDNPVYGTFVCTLLKKHGFSTRSASTLSSAKKLVAGCGEDDIILADLRLPDGESTGLLRWMRDAGMGQPFIVMTDYAEVHTAVESMKLGSADYIPKMLVEDRLPPLLRSLSKEQEPGRGFQAPIFKREGAAFQEIKRNIRMVAPTRIGVLILGENGTGKEHLARMVHDQSRVKEKPFVSVDCGTLSPELAKSELFGHVKGAFTGADSNRDGYFKEADGGTLFLDEVGNLSLETQQMLLRAIQEHRYRPVGGNRECTANVRIVAATNEDLYKAVSERRFRQDLLFRLQEFVIKVPPLRECREDILPLAEFFREQGNRELERHVSGFDASARQALLACPWTGNVRELKQKIQSAVLVTEGDTITEGALGLCNGPVPANKGGFGLKNDEEEKERILRALGQTDGNKKNAARLLGIGRSTLYSKMREYGLNDGPKA
ncbi:sigma-54 dependent transcriptional regulator [Bacteroides uniformis]|uniref:sigma-54-dependent transcriptional regulator n=1 Tax=Bacteroides uniformis TaxID=820 RepID=UPI002165397F|nr:sigma-54 dependent transcriptional regulator [Bacteroides uniformis]MCS3352794.1 sigma-54 dependent transcriptional regulator [Bacteroides uniformis]